MPPKDFVTPRNPLLARLLRSSSVPGADHRDGAGHLDLGYEEKLRGLARDRARSRRERAFVGGTRCVDAYAEASGEDFVKTVTSGEEAGGSPRDDEASEERGGPFVETSASTEFDYATDESNPIGATREPFPRS